MTQIMTPSASPRTMTAGQVDKAVALYRAMLEKHTPDFDAADVQLALGCTELASEQFHVFRHRVETVSRIIVRRAKISGEYTPQEMLDATGRRQHFDPVALAAMPSRGPLGEAQVYFVPLNHYVADVDLEVELAFHGLVPAHPYFVAAVNEEDPAFADKHPNGTHWEGVNGKWCFISFSAHDGDRTVSVHRSRGWSGRWYIAGVKKG